MTNLTTLPRASVTEATLSRHLREVAIRAARSVQPYLVNAFRSPMVIDTKRDFHDIVTVHDKETEKRLIDFILCEVPDSSILGEEGGATGQGSIHWYIDPIDGTANFARGQGFWCVSIGAVVEGEIVAGAVLDPVADLTFSADAEGAWLGSAPLRSRSTPRESDAILITGYPVERDFRSDGREAALDHFGTLVVAFSTLRRPGSSALSICSVAAGWCDAAAGFGVNPWDVTAAILILKQARGTYMPLALHKPPATPDFACPGYVALGEGANYPTLMNVARLVSETRAKAAK